MCVKLSIRDASFGFNDNDLVWKDINIDVQKGECLCLLGPYGCGRTTQLVLIARTLRQLQEIILFDETTSHLDFYNQAMVLRTIKSLSKKGMTIVMTSHFPNHVWDIGTRVAMLGYGCMVAQGYVEEVMTEQNLSKTYGVDTKIYDAKSDMGYIRFCAPNLG